ncbi:hypothetical protein A4X06_0g9360, partial [Tilletia controversa]
MRQWGVKRDPHVSSSRSPPLNRSPVFPPPPSMRSQADHDDARFPAPHPQQPPPPSQRSPPPPHHHQARARSPTPSPPSFVSSSAARRASFVSGPPPTASLQAAAAAAARADLHPDAASIALKKDTGDTRNRLRSLSEASSDRRTRSHPGHRLHCRLNQDYLQHPDLKAINVTPPTKNALPDSSTTTVKPNTNATVVPNGAPSQTLPQIVFTVGQSGSTALISLADHTGNASLLDADGPPRLHAPSAPSSGINTSAVAHQDVTGKGL